MVDHMHPHAHTQSFRNRKLLWKIAFMITLWQQAPVLKRNMQNTDIQFYFLFLYFSRLVIKRIWFWLSDSCSLDEKSWNEKKTQKTQPVLKKKKGWLNQTYQIIWNIRVWAIRSNVCSIFTHNHSAHRRQSILLS